MKTKKRNNAVGPQIREGKPKPKGKVVPILAGASLLGGTQLATQYFAQKMHYHSVLGWNFNHIYPTWDIVSWGMKWGSIYPHELMAAETLGATVAAGGMLVAAGARLFTGNKPQANEFMHGSARWADKADIQKAGLLVRDRTFLEKVSGKHIPSPGGVYVGGWQEKDGTFRYLRHSGPEHVLTYAPTRSGKGVGLVIPTMLSWPDSLIATDLKGELKALTAGWRQKYAKNKTIFWEPASSTGSARWNPLHEVRTGTDYETADIQNIAQLIVDPDGKGLKEHWDRVAFGTITGLITHAIYMEKSGGRIACLGEIDRLLADPEQSGEALWVNMEAATYYPDPETGELGAHPLVVKTARDMLETPEEELGSKISTIKGYLALYRDPVIQKNTEVCDYRIKDLMHYDDPVSLYIITQPADKARLKPLVKLKLNMAMRLLTAEMDFEDGRPKANYKHRLLMMLDEFPALGKLDILQESLAFCAGYGIKAYLICQDLNQLKSREQGYGPDETITSNCHVQNAYPPNRVETAEHLSRLTGTTTIVKESVTESGRRSAAVLGNISRTMTETQRPLLTPDECQRMPGPKKNDAGEIVESGDMVIYVAGYPAIYGKQPLYFKDPVFLKRAQVPTPTKSDVIPNSEIVTPETSVAEDRVVLEPTGEHPDTVEERQLEIATPEEPEEPALMEPELEEPELEGEGHE
jgi:type IV secretion system protein VirD4